MVGGGAIGNGFCNMAADRTAASWAQNFEMREIIASNRCGDPDKATSDGDGPMAAIIRQLPSAKPLVTLLCIHAVKQAPRLEVGVGEAFGSKNEVRSGQLCCSC